MSGWHTSCFTASPSQGMLTATTSYWLTLRPALSNTSSRSFGSGISVKFLRDESLARKSDHMSRIEAK